MKLPPFPTHRRVAGTTTARKKILPLSEQAQDVAYWSCRKGHERSRPDLGASSPHALQKILGLHGERTASAGARHRQVRAHHSCMGGGIDRRALGGGAAAQQVPAAHVILRMTQIGAAGEAKIAAYNLPASNCKTS